MKWVVKAMSPSEGFWRRGKSFTSSAQANAHARYVRHFLGMRALVVREHVA